MMKLNLQFCITTCTVITFGIITCTTPVFGQHLDTIIIDDGWNSHESTSTLNNIEANNNRHHNTTNIDLFILGSTKEYKNKNSKSRRFRGHFKGITLGYTTHLTNTPASANSEMLKLDWGNSFTLGLTLGQKSIPISSNNNFGLVVGLGLEYQRKQFEDSHTTITKNDKGILMPLPINSDYSVRRNTLKHLYLTIPVVFEIQDRGRFFISAGVIGAVSLHSKTKVVYDYGGRKKKQKQTDNFSSTPFKADATVRMGYGCIGVFCNYTFTNIFETDTPEDIHPLTIGMSLIF